MKKVILKSITLVNFKGEKERTTNFNADVTTISGANGLGKSRHFDAFIWCLFGKDTQDRKDYEVKTRINGEELHHAECSVMCVLVVDGAETILKRNFKEDWVKPRGQVEQVFKGHTTECWWNGTPVSVTEYNKRVQEIVADDVFKMITNPAYFASMPWKAQREQLFNLAGNVTDEEIAAINEDFRALLAELNGKSLADFKAEINAKKRQLKDALEQIDPRIDQTRKMMPEKEDYAAIEKDIAAIDSMIADIDNAIADVNKAYELAYKAEADKQKQINLLQSECQKILFDAQAKAREEAYTANADKRAIAVRIEEYKAEVNRLDGIIKTETDNIALYQKQIEYKTQERDALREKWNEVNERMFDGANCPLCGQPLPAESLEEQRKEFVKSKNNLLQSISNDGKALNDIILAVGNNIKASQEKIDSVEYNKNMQLSSIEKLQAQLDSMPEAIATDVVAEDIPEYAAKQKQIAEIAASIKQVEVADTQELIERKKIHNAARAEAMRLLSGRDTIERGEKEIAKLEEEGKSLAQQIADLEKQEYVVRCFTERKINECEKRINKMFSFVTFRLFDYTLEGNAVEVCVPLVNGVPYGSANKAAKVNAGLDIINTLSQFYGISAPIFIDNRESINELVGTSSQIINLVVTTDNKLTVK